MRRESHLGQELAAAERHCLRQRSTHIIGAKSPAEECFDMQNTPLAITLALFASVAFAAPGLAETTQPSAPVHHARRHARTIRQQAALAPLTKASPAKPAADTNAPVPNEGVTAPIDNTDQQTSVAPSVMQIHYPPQGDGYTLGSSAQAMDDREAAKVTGVQMKVPLQ
jgi:hypothetical protein